MVELGCLFDVPLDDDESAALGLALPAAGETPSDARRRLSPQPPQPRQPELKPDPDGEGDGESEGLIFGDLDMGPPDGAA